MNTVQISHAIWSSIASRNDFRGTFAFNNIPYNQLWMSYPFCFVMNTDNREGQHWIAVFSSEPGHIEIFDPAGCFLLDVHLRKLSPLLQHYGNATIVHFNIERLQDFCGTVCGEFCILFIFCRCAGVMFDTFLNSFNPWDTLSNDLAVYSIVHSYFEILPYPRLIPDCYIRR